MKQNSKKSIDIENKFMVAKWEDRLSNENNVLLILKKELGIILTHSPRNTALPTTLSCHALQWNIVLILKVSGTMKKIKHQK